MFLPSLNALVLILMYLDYFHKSIGGSDNFERWLSLEDFYSRHPYSYTGYISQGSIELLEAKVELTDLK